MPTNLWFTILFDLTSLHAQLMVHHQRQRFTGPSPSATMSHAKSTGDLTRASLARQSCGSVGKQRQLLEPVAVNMDSVFKHTDQFCRSKFYSSSLMNEICELERYFESKSASRNQQMTQPGQNQRADLKIMINTTQHSVIKLNW